MVKMTNLLDQLTYNRWANLRLIDVTTELDGAKFTKTIMSSFPSVQQTWTHIIWAEELWLNRWQGRSFVRKLDPNDYPTIVQIKQKIEDLSAAQIQFINDLNPEDENQKISYKNFHGEKMTYTLRQMVQHKTMHSAYHRGQLVTFFRQLGVKPLSTDYLVYIDDNNIV